LGLATRHSLFEIKPQPKRLDFVSKRNERFLENRSTLKKLSDTLDLLHQSTIESKCHERRLVQGKFGYLLGNKLHNFHANVSKSRSDLENQSVETSSTSEAVSVITYVQTLKSKLKDWERKVDQYGNAQKILERQRYQFPSNWLYTDYIQGILFDNFY